MCGSVNLLDLFSFSRYIKYISIFQIDMVIHNAGRSQRARWDHTDLGVDRDLFDLNVFAPVNLSRLIMPQFHSQAGGGTFVIVSSLAGRFGVPFSGTYTGSKHAINVSCLMYYFIIFH